MVFSVSGGSIYLIEVTSNQNHQSKIGSLHISSDPNMFSIDSIIRPLHTNTSPKISAKTIWSGPRWYYPETTTVYPSSPVNQCLQQRFWPAITGHQIIVGNTTTDTPVLAENECDLSKLLPLLCNLTLEYDTTIVLKMIMIKLLWPLSLHQEITSYSTGLLPYYTSKYLLWLLVTSVGELFDEKSSQTYIIMSSELAKEIINSILCPASTLLNKFLQYTIMEDDGIRML